MIGSLFVSCSINYIDYRKINQVEDECRKECKSIQESSSDWCDCMIPCLNKEDNISIKIQECQSELEEPKEQIEPEEGVIPEVPDVKTPKINMNILDGEIISGSTTLKTEDIIKDCKKECATFTISSDEWCDCMNQCSQKVFDKISFGDMNVKIYIEECP